jgi:hypothetical protein
MKYRAQEGEEITGESYLMRDLWQTTNIPRGAIRSFAKNPRPWGFSGITKGLNTAWRVQGIRGFLPEGKTRHEFKQSHGLIKFHDTQTNTVMGPLYSELLRGHNIGLPEHYLRPTEQELLREYLKAVPLLTISEIDKATVEQTRKELNELKASKLDPAVIDQLIADNKEMKEIMRTAFNVHVGEKTIVRFEMSDSQRDNLDCDSPRIEKNYYYKAQPGLENAPIKLEKQDEKEKQR